MNRSIDFIDPCRMTTVKDLYCFHRTGRPRLEFLIRHRKLVNDLKLAETPLHFYNRLLTDLTHNELKLVVLMALDRIKMKSIFVEKSRHKVQLDNHISPKVKTVYDLLKVYECIVASLHSSSCFDKKEVHMDLYNYKEILSEVNIESYNTLLDKVSFYSPPENYWIVNHYKGGFNPYTRNAWKGYETQFTGLKPVGLTSDSYGASHFKSRPFREGKTYPKIKSYECKYRMRDLMFGMDQNTCNAWVKRYTTKLKKLKISEEDFMDLVHKPIELLTEEDLKLGLSALSISESDSTNLLFYKYLTEDNRYISYKDDIYLFKKESYVLSRDSKINLNYDFMKENNDEPLYIYTCRIEGKNLR